MLVDQQSRVDMKNAQLGRREFTLQGHSYVTCVRDRRCLLVDLEFESALVERLLSEWEEVEQKPLAGQAVTARAGVGLISIETSNSSLQGVLRRYFRGGLLGRIVKRRFLNRGVSNGIGHGGISVFQTRPFSEFMMLSFLHLQQAAVVQPLACGVKYDPVGLCYSGFIISREMESAVSLEELLVGCGQEVTGKSGSGSMPRSDLLDCCRKAGAAVRRVISLGVAHADLHAGNILVGSLPDPVLGRPLCLIDFDKARWLSKLDDRAMVGRAIAERFRRGLAKRGVGDEFARAFEEGVN